MYIFIPNNIVPHIMPCRDVIYDIRMDENTGIPMESDN